ncbi:MAG TPA: CheR family methyltransferase [Nevskia sp.]|jgi:chemotaxis protein methyltransferase CheR|nr:CheR family methyltransferase [Nevskia sp.]
MTATAALREFAYSKRDFERARELIRERAGIALSPCKEDMVYGRLARRVRQHGLGSVGEYLDFLERSDEAEWQAFTNALTTNLTAFFREPHHFDTLRQLFGRLGREPLRLWCAAASTGEEPYSMAMTAVEHFGGFDAPVRVLATDIDTQVLATAQQGIYPMQRTEKLSPERLRRFFLRGTGANEGQCRVVEGLRRMIEFRPLNLLDPQWNLRGPFDAVFCRNVMIYFDKPTQYRILARIMPLLARDGLFFAGHSESFFHAADLLRPLGRTVYAHVERRH